ncbi:sulfotransferase [Aureococcus anophagefferens]|nr:sulfotransferase [Aureococcus anophagefferens]
MMAIFCAPSSDEHELRSKAAMHAAKPVHSLLKLDDPYDVEATKNAPADGSKESYLAGRKWVPRADDVVVATFSKSGTTFMCNVCHQLRSKCEANDFEEITEAKDCGQDLDADQACSPRIFKSHMNPSNVNPGCRVVYVVRDPVKVALSYFAFLKVKGAPFVKDVANALDFVDHPIFMAGPVVSSSKRGNVWQFLVETWFARLKDGALVVPYEDAVQDTPKWIAKTAAFMGVDCDAALVDNVAKHTDKQYMLDHATQFDDHWITEQQAKAGRGFVVQKGSKVTTTTHEKPDGLDEKMQAHCDVYVKPITGHATYADMLADLAA